MIEFWEKGQKQSIAKEADIKYSHLWEILHRRRGVGRDRAIVLEKASEKVLGKVIPFREWLFNTTSDHRAFYGKPKN